MGPGPQLLPGAAIYSHDAIALAPQPSQEKRGTLVQIPALSLSSHVAV